MNTPATLNTALSESAGMPRWMGILLGLLGFPLVHGVLPWALALLTLRHGWSARHPRRWNLLGLLLVGAGTLFAGWGLVLHMSEGWQWESAQRYLLRRGPYRFSRNPMYVGELALWLGWAVFYGSVAVLLGFVAWGLGFSRYIVPQEERALEARFGESYLRYKQTVPRWLGRIRL